MLSLNRPEQSRRFFYAQKEIGMTFMSYINKRYDIKVRL